MKRIPLRGTDVEISERLLLLRSKEFLFKDSAKSNFIRNTLRKFFPSMKTAYILNSYPGLEVDFYEILIDNHSVINIEFNSYNGNLESILDSIQNLNEYVRGKTQINQIILSVALDLADQDLGIKK